MRDEFPRFMKMGQAQKFFNIGSSNTLYKWIAQGLKVIVIDGTKRIDQKDALDFLEKHKIG
ncbi:DNA-binding protein [Ligilactobacillus acidipiscis]|uniref:DNA-binding protein n=1 Tax=Ligilactobacillus acidipiscis TaxID=89059 RepID=UPI0023F7A63D|nr:DNA-binding protein [Ligilactobacillus acidipiscis]WEV57834.1 DNA-binding protein [Ligilactobacillus acidipiscis]